MTNELDDFRRQSFVEAPPAGIREQDLCLRLEVLLVKMQDRDPLQATVPALVEKLNQLGHRFEARDVPGLDHFFQGALDDGRILEIRCADEWFSVRVRPVTERDADPDRSAGR